MSQLLSVLASVHSGTGTSVQRGLPVVQQKLICGSGACVESDSEYRNVYVVGFASLSKVVTPEGDTLDLDKALCEQKIDLRENHDKYLSLHTFGFQIVGV